jgi:hypothetical protein
MAFANKIIPVWYWLNQPVLPTSEEKDNPMKIEYSLMMPEDCTWWRTVWEGIKPERSPAPWW